MLEADVAVVLVADDDDVDSVALVGTRLMLANIPPPPAASDLGLEKEEDDDDCADGTVADG